MTQTNERRFRRGKSASEAVQFQLQHVADVLDLDAIVVADELGDSVAFAGDLDAARVLADGAMFGVYGENTTLDDVTLGSLQSFYPAARPFHVVSRRLEISGQENTYMVYAFGRSAGRAAGLDHAVRGITRICEKSFPGQSLARRF